MSLFSYRLPITFTLAGLLMFQGPDLMASEGQSTSTQTTEYSRFSRAAMDIPLSTWVSAGDVVRIKAYPDTGSFVSGNYVILDSGFVILPLLGLVQVTHLSITGLTSHLTESYAKYLAYPTIQVEPLIHLSMLGGFLRPGMYLVNPLYPFSSALHAAGGTIRDDGLKMLRWERGGKVLATDLTSEVEGTRSLWASGFKSGDQVCITLRTKRDLLPVVSFIVSTLVATGTLTLTILVLTQ